MVTTAHDWFFSLTDGRRPLVTRSAVRAPGGSLIRTSAAPDRLQLVHLRRHVLCDMRDVSGASTSLHARRGRRYPGRGSYPRKSTRRCGWCISGQRPRFHPQQTEAEMSQPEAFGRYRVIRRLGSGSFATVWLAQDDLLNHPVAIKVLAENWAHQMDIQHRFLEEARILRQTDSTWLVAVHDVDVLPDGRPYMVMTYA